MLVLPFIIPPSPRFDSILAVAKQGLFQMPGDGGLSTRKPVRVIAGDMRVDNDSVLRASPVAVSVFVKIINASGSVHLEDSIFRYINHFRSLSSRSFRFGLRAAKTDAKVSRFNQADCAHCLAHIYRNFLPNVNRELFHFWGNLQCACLVSDWHRRIKELNSSFFLRNQLEFGTIHKGSHGFSLSNVLYPNPQRSYTEVDRFVRDVALHHSKNLRGSAEYYPGPMLGHKISLALDVIPDIDAKDQDSGYYSDSFGDPFKLFCSASGFPMSPDGFFLMLAGFLFGGFVCTCFVCCLSFRSTWRRILWSLGMAMLGVIIFHVGLLYLGKRPN